MFCIVLGSQDHDPYSETGLSSLNEVRVHGTMTALFIYIYLSQLFIPLEFSSKNSARITVWISTICFT